MEKNNKLAEVVTNSGIETGRAQQVLDNFIPFFEQVAIWEKQVKDLVITDITQTKEMELAGKARKALKDIRCDAENARKKLKEKSLLEGRFIDSVYNLVECSTKPLESELLEKEKFVERIEEKKKAELKAQRFELLKPYTDTPEIYNLDNMTDEIFLMLLEKVKAQHEAMKEQQARADAERIEADRIEAEKRQAIEKENERLKFEAEIRALELEEERKKAEAEKEKQAEALRIEKEKADKAQQELKKIQDQKEKEEREKREAEIRAQNAGDAEKILAYITALENEPMPALKSDQAVGIVMEIRNSLRIAKNAVGML